MSHPTKSARLHQLVSRRRARWLAAASLALAGVAPDAWAASTVWAPTTTGDFNNGANWSAGLPGPGDIATFTGPFGTAPNTFQPNLTGNISIAELLFSDSTTFGYDLTSSSPTFALTLLGSTAISSVGAGVNTLDANLVLGAAGTGQNISISSGGTLVINGSISGAGGLTSAGSGTLKLNGANTYTGGTIISGGTSVQINNSQALGSGAISLAGTIDNASGAAITISNANPLTLAGNFVFTGSNSLAFNTGSITMAVSPTITVNANTLTLSGLFDATTTGLTKAGGGTLVLSNTGLQGFTGTASVTAGTLEVDGTLSSTTATVGGTGTLRIFNPNALALADVTGSSSGGAVLALRSDSDATFATKSLTITSGLTINADQATGGNTGHVLSVGDLTITGVNATLNAGGGNGYTVKVGTVTVGVSATNNLGNSSTNGAFLTVGALKGGATANVTTLTGPVGGTILGGVSDGAAPLGITKSNTGTWSLGGVSTYTGATTISQGVLQINGTLGATAISLGAGTLRLTRADAVAAATSLTNTSGSAVLELMNDASTSFTLPGVIIGANLTINATQATAAGAGQTLSLTNPITLPAFTITGTSTAGGDTLALGAITTTGATAGLSANSGTFTVASVTGASGAAQILTLGGVTPGVGIVTGAIANGTSTVSVTKSGTGTWILLGNNTYTGATTVSSSGGVLQVGNGGTSGSLGSTASVTVNTGGALRFNHSDALTVSTNILGTGTVQQNGSGVLTLAGTGSTWSGGLVINAGSVRAGNGSAGVIGTGLVTLANNTTLDLNGFNETTGLLSTSGTGAGAVITSLAANTPVTLTIGGAAGPQTFAGSINETSAASAISLTLNNTVATSTVVQVLSGANNYSGVTTIANGYLNLQNNLALGSTAGGTVVSGGRVQLQGGVKIVGEALTLNGVSSAIVLENVSGDNEWAGPISVNTLITQRVNAAAGNLTLSGPVQLSTSGTQDANGFLPQGPGTVIISGNISGIGKISQGVSSTGTLVLSGDNSAWSGGLKVVTGTVRSLDTATYTGNATVKSTFGTAALALTSGALDLRVNGQDDSSAQTLSFINALIPATSSTTAINVDRQGGSGTGKTIAFASTALTTGTNWNITGDHGYALNLGATTFNSTSGTALLNPTTANVIMGTVQNITGSPSSVTPAQLVLGGTSTGNVITGSLTKNGSATASIMGLVKANTSTWTLQGTASTYSQPTVLLGGTLSISALANLNTASSIGLGLTTNNAGSLLLNGGKLQFTGAGAGATDRLFTVATGGGSLDASGTTAVIFANTGANAVTDSGPQTGTTGNNTSVVTVLSSINDLAVGQAVSGGNIATGTTITAIDPAARSITLSQPTAATGGAAGTTLTFGTLDRTLTLTGTSTLDNVLFSTLGNSPNAKLSLAKSGAGTWILANANTFTGSTVVSGGTLRGSAEGVLGATSSVTVTNAAALLLLATTNTQNGRINDAAPITLATGGLLGYASGENSRTETLGALTIASTGGVLDLGAGTGNTLIFNGLTSLAGSLQVQHWTGSIYNIGGTDSGDANQDRLLFAAGTVFTPAQLADISFFGDNNAFLGTAQQINYNGQVELVASVPEPTSLASLLTVGAFLGLRRRRSRAVSLAA